mmetsp:Transcript_24956/g.63301  ORF Transcript_24956/g.63301 Transcript_24956/m.63301 type:complete len:208 (-) Transcript_24956:489-1112(-)
MRDDRVEVFLAHHHQHGPRHRVRGRRDRALPPADHAHRQGPRAQGGVLQAEPPERDQLDGDSACLRLRHLLSGLPRRPAGQIPHAARDAGHLSHQTLLHVQHADYPANGARLQPLLPLAAPLQALPGEHHRAPHRRVAGRRGRPVDQRTRRRLGLLHLPAQQPDRGDCRPAPRPRLLHLHPGLLRTFLQDVDRGLWLKCQGRGEAAP